jgi:threonine/homoserine/homoserine lactone efflux protein
VHRLIAAEIVGYMISIVTLGLTLGPATHAAPGLLMVLRLAAGVYLVVLALRLWRQEGPGLVSARSAVGPAQIFVATLLNPKAVILALGVVPFGAAYTRVYLLALCLLIILTALVWIAAGVRLGKAVEWRGWGWIVPRLSAIGVGTFALLFLYAAISY